MVDGADRRLELRLLELIARLRRRGIADDVCDALVVELLGLRVEPLDDDRPWIDREIPK